MSSFLTKLISVLLPKALNWALEKGSYLLKIFKMRSELKKTQEKNTEQGEVVAKIAEEIQAYIARGEPVPKELKEKLRAESKKLSDSSAVSSDS